jgi:hypothetical protein
MARLDQYNPASFVGEQIRNLVFEADDATLQFFISWLQGAANYVIVQGNVAGQGPVIAVLGSDTNADLNVAAKGTGGVWLGNGDGPIFGVVDNGVSQLTVNWLSAFAGQSGAEPGLQATGADTDIDITLKPKGLGTVNCQTPVKFPAYTVATLPAVASNLNCRAFVTDSSVTTFNSVVAGGGSTRVPVWCDGANWRVG